MTRWTMLLVIVLFVANAWAAEDIALKDEAASEDDYASVVNLALKMQDDLEVVRRYFGQAQSELKRFDAEHASNRHAFLLAQSIYRKVNLLSQELAGRSAQSPPAAPNRATVAADAFGVMERAYNQLAIIQSEYKLIADTKDSKPVKSATSTEAVEAMISVLRQINLMLDRQYRAEDVYERLDLATVYVAGVLEARGGIAFPVIEFVPNKQPVDVFRKLLDCVDLSAKVADIAGVDALKINVRRMRSSDTRLSNNYDLASIMLSDIAVWTEALEGADDIFPEDVSIRYIVPSHVFQKASQLEAQIQAVLTSLQ